jgi:hypothetical protein
MQKKGRAVVNPPHDYYGKISSDQTFLKVRMPVRVAVQPVGFRK